MHLNNLYTYWEGPKPAYIDLCQESLRKYCGKDFNIYILDSCKEYNHLPINQKVDWLKANLVYEHGGFWIDADMLVMKKLKPLIELVEKHGFAGIPGFFGAEKGNPILKEWIDGMDKILKRDKSHQFSDLIQPLLKSPFFKEFGIFTKEMICPIYHTGDEFWKFFENLPTSEVLTENTFMVTLYNSQFSFEFKEMNREELLSQPWLISKLFKKSLCLE